MDYQVRFEELRSLMLNSHPILNESYFVSNFIRGLKDEIRSTMKMMHPATVNQAAEKARQQEWTLEAIYRKHGLQSKGYIKSSQQIGGTPKVVEFLRLGMDDAGSEERPPLE